MPKKNDNIEDNINSDNNTSIIIKKSSGVDNKNLVSKADFLIPGAKIAFAQLKKAFIKTLILYYFEPDLYIWTKIDASRYTIKGILSQLTLETR